MNPGWSAAASVAWVVIAQGIAGIAKDVTKTASKSAIKATSAEGSGQLFRWVAWFTGSKNAMKGIGFFIGGLLLDLVGFQPALWLMAALLGVILVAGLFLLPVQLGKAKSSKSVRELFGKSRGVNLLGRRPHLHVRRARRLVRRGPARISLRQRLALPGGRRISGDMDHCLWRHPGDSAVAGHAQRRRLEPRGAGRPTLGRPARGGSGRPWRLSCSFRALGDPTSSWSAGSLLFGIPFAVNSSLHSYLILAYAGSEKAAEDVGFYYAANATGRLMGILLSGSLYQLGGIAACLIGSAVMLAICWLSRSCFRYRPSRCR